MSNSQLPSPGTLYLWFSCWDQPPQSTSEEGVDKDDVFEWLAEHVFCEDDDSSSVILNTDSIHLMDPLLMENVCANFPSSREIDYSSDTIVWNMPAAEVDPTTLLVEGFEEYSFNYMIWNVSFPTYRWGEPDTQRKLQRSFELRLQNKYIAQDSLDGCRVSVVGEEADFWLLSTRINQGEKDAIQLAGILFFVAQTLVVILVPLAGKWLVRRESRILHNNNNNNKNKNNKNKNKNNNNNRETNSEGRSTIDEMLITSKGFLDIDIPQFDTPPSTDLENAVGDVEQTGELNHQS